MFELSTLAVFPYILWWRCLVDPWAGGFCFCAIILELLGEALAGTSVARKGSRRGVSEATGQEQGRGEGGWKGGTME